jgi:ADP-ribosylglycohydrolase
LDRIKGCFFGCAIGDALGWPVEFDSSIEGGSRVVTDLVIREPEKVALYTDDTQMTRAVAEGIIRAARSSGVETMANEIAEEFIAWLQDPETPDRAPGASCLEGCRNLAKGMDWKVSGRENSKGCGAAMRSAPYGLFFHEDPWKAAEYAAHHAQMTHLHPEASASAAAVATGVAGCIGDASWDMIVERMVMSTMTIDPEGMFQLLNEAYLFATPGPGSRLPKEVLNRWRGWTGGEAVAASLYCALRHQDSFEEAVLEAVNSPGDSDSLGAITGAFMGARLGFEAIPERWRAPIEKRDELISLSTRFARAMVHGGQLLPDPLVEDEAQV